MNPLEILQKHFGYVDFRRGQWEIIEAVIAGKNCVVIMPTGGGKSMCYQIPAMCMPGVAIVVSPLIALMKDQIDSLTEVGIPATFINSSITQDEIGRRYLELLDNKFKLLYVAPERLGDPQFLEVLKKMPISLVAIDEAHCISEWGHDFRPSYLRIKNLVQELPGVRVIALTATATPEVRIDIIKQLNLAEYEQFIYGFDRPNLNFKVEMGSKNEKLYKLLQFVKSSPKPGIVYAGTRNTADQITEILNSHEIKAVNYHAGLEASARVGVQNSFTNNIHDGIVAANAFGMGVDKQNIRFVVHYDIPGTMEAYYQEAGRAGRDGQQANCLLLYNPADRYLREFFIKGDNPTKDNIQDIYNVICNFKSEPVTLTYSQIKEQMSEEIPEMGIGSAIKLLERAGYLELAGENQKEAYIKFVSSLSEIINAVGQRATKKLAVIESLFASFADEIFKGVNFNLEKLLQSSDIAKDSFVRALRELDKLNLIKYEPPFRGKEIYVKKRVHERELELDWAALEKKLDADLAKLNLMEGYVYHTGDKREYILNYFGEKR